MVVSNVNAQAHDFQEQGGPEIRSQKDILMDKNAKYLILPCIVHTCIFGPNF